MLHTVPSALLLRPPSHTPNIAQHISLADIPQVKFTVHTSKPNIFSVCSIAEWNTKSSVTSFEKINYFRDLMQDS